MAIEEIFQTDVFLFFILNFTLIVKSNASVIITDERL